MSRDRRGRGGRRGPPARPGAKERRWVEGAARRSGRSSGPGGPAAFLAAGVQACGDFRADHVHPALRARRQQRVDASKDPERRLPRGRVHPVSYLTDRLIYRSVQKRQAARLGTLSPQGRRLRRGRRRSALPRRARTLYSRLTRMSLDVVQLPLGPIETNCYLVRLPGAPEAVVVDPSGPATDIRLELAGREARCVAILVTHGHWDHLGEASRTSRRAPARRYTWPRPSCELLERAARTSLRPGSRFTRSRRTSCSPVNRNSRPCGDRLRGPSPCRATLLATSRSRPTGLCSRGDVLFAGSVGRTDLPGASGDAGCLHRRPARPASGGDCRLPGARPGHDARPGARDEPVPRRIACRALLTLEP